MLSHKAAKHMGDITEKSRAVQQTNKGNTSIPIRVAPTYIKGDINRYQGRQPIDIQGGNWQTSTTSTTSTKAVTASKTNPTTGRKTSTVHT
jgi:hypothetical protein